MDGNIKFSKDVRGYDETDKDDVQSENMDNDVDEDLQKYMKPLRETHSKYLKYLTHIDFKKETNTASVDISLSLDFKKVLMLTIAEETLSKVLVRSVPNIEKCTLVKPKNENDEPHLVV
jgi:hypothetical protein